MTFRVLGLKPFLFFDKQIKIEKTKKNKGRLLLRDLEVGSLFAKRT